MAAGVLKELASKGFAGVVTGAILAGLMEAAFGVAINSIEGFATSGKVTGGTPIRRSNGDDVLITAKKGEVIMNETHQMQLSLMGIEAGIYFLSIEQAGRKIVKKVVIEK